MTTKHSVYLKAARGEYVAAKDLAKLVRDALKRAFPETTFSVTTKSSINVRWFDGPTSKQVEAIAGAFETRGFDGSIDLAHHNSLWIYPDGSAHIAHDSGTVGSMGQAPEVIESPRGPDAVLLDNVASDFVFCSRSLSPWVYERAIAQIRAENWACLENVDWSRISVKASSYNGAGVIEGAGYIQFDGPRQWLDGQISHVAHSYDLRGEAPPSVEPQPIKPEPVAPVHAPCLCW